LAGGDTSARAARDTKEGYPGRFFYAQDVRYFAIEHMEKVRPGTGRETGLGHVRREAFQAGTAYKIQLSNNA
jgi:hypothetical protein